MSILFRSSCAAFCASLLASTLLISGCADSSVMTAASNPAAITVTGNWQLSSTAAAASRLSALSGSLTGTSKSISGILHADSASACIMPTTAIAVTGSADPNRLLTLTGTGLAGGTLTVTGTLAADGKSLSNASYNVAGGTCAFGTAAPATGQAYTPINGNFSGPFSDTSGQSMTVTASITQNPASDTTGNFQLSGTGTFTQNPCIASPATVTNSQVTGGAFDIFYTDANSQNQVEAQGTVSTDGTTLTVAKWTLTGSCRPDTGTGTLTKQ